MITFRQFLENEENKNIKTEIIDNIKVIGDDEFIAKTKKALLLLNASKTFNQIKKFIGIIQQSARSGMVYWNKPGYTWKKIHGVHFQPNHIIVAQISTDPNSFDNYSES